MRYIINRVLVVLFVLTFLAFGAFVGYRMVQSVNTPPVLSCESETVSVSIHDGEEALLAGVTATDKEDGDLTDRVLIESVSRFIETGVCRVTYVVQDSDRAVVKCTRELHYTDYTSPQFTLTAPLVFDFGKKFEPADNLRVTDCIDGDISDNIRMTLLEEGTTISGVGKWNVEFRATNSKGDTVYLNTHVTVRNQTAHEKQYTPSIKLKKYLVYVPKNSTFNPADYVDGVTIATEGTEDNPATLRAKLRSSSNVDTATPGLYTVTYTCTSVNGYKGEMELLVVVTDD